MSTFVSALNLVDAVGSFVKEKVLRKSTKSRYPEVPVVPVCFDYRTYLSRGDLAPSGFLRPELDEWLDKHGVRVVQHKTGRADKPLVLYFDTETGWRLFEAEAPYNRQ